jgi:hypothetical protein
MPCPDCDIVIDSLLLSEIVSGAENPNHLFTGVSLGETISDAIHDTIIDTSLFSETLDDSSVYELIYDAVSLDDDAYEARFTDTFSEVINLSNTLADRLSSEVIDDLLLVDNISNEVVSDEVRDTLTVPEALGTTGGAATEAVTTTVSLDDTLTDRSGVRLPDISVAFVVSDELSDSPHFPDTVDDSLYLASVVQGVESIVDSVSDKLIVSDTHTSILSRIADTLGDILIAYDALTLTVDPLSDVDDPSTVPNCVVVNAHTQAVGFYRFREGDMVGVAHDGDKFLFSGYSNLYSLDLKTAINEKATLSTYANDWNIATIKRFSAMHVYGSTTVPSRLIVNDKWSYTQQEAGKDTSRKFKLGRGLRSRWMKFRLELYGHATIDAMSVDVARTQHKRTQ